jgi:soluble lytic murein transglycosylase
MGRLVLARALLAQGDRDGGAAQLREAWRNDQLSADVEKQVLDRYGEFLSNVDHKARMEKRLFADDNEAALRAARRLGGAQVAIAQARIALDRKPGDARAHDGKSVDGAGRARGTPGTSSRRCTSAPRRQDRRAAKALLAAPRELSQIHDPEEWWVERRIMARKLLDAGDHRSAYQAVAEAAEPTKENSRLERHFMAGWIALRYLDDCPATAATHFARIPDVSSHPTPWRAHSPPGRGGSIAAAGEARARYQAAASASASYGQRCPRPARLTAPAAAAGEPAWRGAAVGRARRDPHALNERPLAIALMAGAGEAVDDVGTLSALGELAQQRGPRHAAHGKAALSRPAARPLRVSDRRRPGLRSDRPRHRQRAAVRHHPPGEHVRSGRLVARPRDGPDAGDAGRRQAHLQALQLHLQRQAPTHHSFTFCRSALPSLPACCRTIAATTS